MQKLQSFRLPGVSRGLRGLFNGYDLSLKLFRFSKLASTVTAYNLLFELLNFPNISSVGKDGEPDTEDDIVNWRDVEEGGDAGDVPTAADLESTGSQ